MGIETSVGYDARSDHLTVRVWIDFPWCAKSYTLEKLITTERVEDRDRAMVEPYIERAVADGVEMVRTLRDAAVADEMAQRGAD